VGQLQRLPGVLLDQQHGCPRLVDLLQHAEDVAHEQRRQAHRGLVQQHQPAARHQRPRHRQHLLLAS
jgi:hypothetical protein